MPIIEHAKDPLHLGRPSLAGVRPVLGGPEGIIGNEHLPAIGIERAPDLLRTDALVRFPPVRQLRERDRPRDRGLAHLRRTAQNGKPMSVEDPERVAIRPRGHEHGRQGTRGRNVQRGASCDLSVDQLIEVTQPEDRRHRATQLGTGVQSLTDLDAAQDPHRHALTGELTADSGLELRGTDDVGQDHERSRHRDVL